jgi:hypothetical protein
MRRESRYPTLISSIVPLSARVPTTARSKVGRVPPSGVAGGDLAMGASIQHTARYSPSEANAATSSASDPNAATASSHSVSAADPPESVPSPSSLDTRPHCPIWCVVAAVGECTDRQPSPWDLSTIPRIRTLCSCSALPNPALQGQGRRLTPAPAPGLPAAPGLRPSCGGRRPPGHGHSGHPGTPSGPDHRAAVLVGASYVKLRTCRNTSGVSGNSAGRNTACQSPWMIGTHSAEIGRLSSDW